MDDLTSQFVDLEVSNTASYDITRNKCRISLKKAHLHSVNLNSYESLEKICDWVTRQQLADMDYLSNCVFIDETAFHVNIKRAVTWSKVGAKVVLPNIRVKTVTTLGAICAIGVINVKRRNILHKRPARDFSNQYGLESLLLSALIKFLH